MKCPSHQIESGRNGSAKSAVTSDEGGRANFANKPFWLRRGPGNDIFVSICHASCILAASLGEEVRCDSIDDTHRAPGTYVHMYARVW